MWTEQVWLAEVSPAGRGLASILVGGRRPFEFVRFAAAGESLLMGLPYIAFGLVRLKPISISLLGWGLLVCELPDEAVSLSWPAFCSA